MTKLTKKNAKKLGVQVVLALVGLIGFFLVLSSTGTVDGDFITLSLQLSWNVRICVIGFALISLAVTTYRVLFKD